MSEEKKKEGQEIYLKSLENRKNNLQRRLTALTFERNAVNTKIVRLNARKKEIAIDIKNTETQLAGLTERISQFEQLAGAQVEDD